MKKYDIAVAYRIYPAVSKVPPIYSKDKPKLAELCLHSFKKSLDGLRVKMYVLLDNCPPEYDAMFLRHFAAEDIEFIRLKGAGNLATFSMQIDLLLKQTDAEYIYFAEDDYFYLDGKFGEMLDFLKAHPDADFATPYDHLDYYTSELHRHKKEERVFKNRRWHTAGSTCLTFLTTKKMLAETQEVFKSYSRGNGDAALWAILTKQKVTEPIAGLKFTLRGGGLFRIFVKAWLYGAKNLLFGKKYKLWSPVPAIGTHMDHLFLSPEIDWQAHFAEAQKELNF